MVIFESGAIVTSWQYGKAAAALSMLITTAYAVHYAEGSAMLPLMLWLYVGVGDAGAAQPHSGEMQNHLGFLNEWTELLRRQRSHRRRRAVDFVAQVAVTFGGRGRIRI